MCKSVVINRGEKEITTPREFKNHFGYLPTKHDFYALEENEQFSEQELDSCLCFADIVSTLRLNEVQFKNYLGNIYVGELDFVEVG